MRDGPLPPAANHGARPTLGSEPQQVPRLTEGISPSGLESICQPAHRRSQLISARLGPRTARRLRRREVPDICH